MVMLNELEYQGQVFLYNLLIYMNTATAQPDKKNKHKIQSTIKKLKPKHMYSYDTTKDVDVKDELEDLEEFRKNIGKSPENGD